MPYIADTPYSVGTVQYIISSQHRKVGNPNKCAWIISFDEEIGCFSKTISESWVNGDEGWGLKLDGNNILVVGHSFHGQELKIAKFVDGNRTDIWHGYPADPMSKQQDRPTTFILQSWVKSGYITKAKMSKLRLGQSCNL